MLVQGQNIVVGMGDTGIDVKHCHFADSTVPFANFQKVNLAQPSTAQRCVPGSRVEIAGLRAQLISHPVLSFSIHGLPLLVERLKSPMQPKHEQVRRLLQSLQSDGTSPWSLATAPQVTSTKMPLQACMCAILCALEGVSMGAGAAWS